MSLAKVKAIDRVDALGKKYDETLFESLSMLNSHRSVDSPEYKRQHYFILENNNTSNEKASEKYFVMIRDKKRTSLTYRYVN